MTQASFELKIVSPNGKKIDLEVSSVSLPTDKGQISILANHTNLIALLRPGEIVYHEAKGEHILVTEGGIIEVANGSVKILADRAETTDELDQNAIERARENAQKMLSDARDDADYAAAAAALEKQLAKLSILAKRKRKYQ